MTVAAPLRFPASLRARLSDGDTRLVVTGAGGWLGRATLEMLDDALGDGMGARVHAYAASARRYRLRSGRELPVSALPELAGLPADGRPLAMAHYAFLTREKTAGMPGTRYVETNRAITRLAAENAGRLEAIGTFSTSSGAVYRPDGSLEASLDDNPYGALKREEEEAFGALREGRGTRAVICRVFNLAGPFLNKDYALGSVVADVLAGRPIRIRARHRVVRSYAHVRDVVTAGFAAALGAAECPPGPFDTAGDEAVEVGDLARRARAALGRPDLAVERPEPPDGREDRYVGDGTSFRRLLAQAGGSAAGLDDGIRDTAAYLAEAGRTRSDRSPSLPSGVPA